MCLVYVFVLLLSLMLYICAEVPVEERVIPFYRPGCRCSFTLHLLL